MRRLTKKIPDPSLNQHTISFTYNPTGLPQVMDELASGSVTRTYAYGLQRISENQLISGTWKPSFYGYDGHGDVRLLTNTAGTVTDTYQYDAFGNQIASTGSTPNNFLFSGEQFDSSVGSLYLRARYYRLPTGRFLTMDPDEGSILNPATLHKYVYTRNNGDVGVGVFQRELRSRCARNLFWHSFAADSKLVNSGLPRSFTNKGSV